MIRELCKQARGLVDTFSVSKGLLPHGAVKRSSRSSEITTEFLVEGLGCSRNSSSAGC